MRSHGRLGDSSPSDGDLLARARGGDVASLGLLLERHRPRLLATALRILGYTADAEDAVQETCLVAMRYLGTVRDPEAIGAWLQSVLRRECLQQQRRQRGEILTDAFPDVMDGGPGPEDRVDRLELRDWIWGALQRLPEVLRVSAMLRYFGSYDSYDELAAILGVPIGTVRSRLSEAKAKLADALLASAGLIDDDARVKAKAHERLWFNAFDSVSRRGDSYEFVRHCALDLVIGWSDGKMARGRHHLEAEIEGDIAAGVRLDVERVMASNGVTVIEGRFSNPPESPEHCPPGIGLVVFGKDEQASRMRLHLSPRLPRLDDE